MPTQLRIRPSITAEEAAGLYIDDARALAALALIGVTDVALLGLAVARAAVAAVAVRALPKARAKTRREMKVEQIMTRSPVTCRPDDPLTEAARLMWEHDCGCVPVVRDSETHPCGMITDRDVCMAAYHQGRVLADIRVGEVMATEIRVCSPHDSVEEAGRAMRGAQVRRLPVVDESEGLVGIVSLADIAREVERRPGARRRGLCDKDLGGTLASIVRPHTQAPA